MYIWKNRCLNQNYQLKSLIEKLRTFSIGNVMQIEPKSIENHENTVWDEL